MSKSINHCVSKKRRGLIGEIRDHWILFLMILPAVVYFLVFSYGPMVGVYYAFTEYTYDGGFFGSPFVGLQNFVILFKTGAMSYLIKNTVLYNLVFILLGNVIEVLTAVLLDRLTCKWFKRTTQAAVLFPYVLSYVLIQVFTYALFNSQVGTITLFVRNILGIASFNPYRTPGLWKYVIVITYLWKNIGYGMIIYAAALTGISDEYYEAARIDGATALQQIRYITLPLLVPTFVILLLLALGGILRGQFELFYQIIGSNGLLYEQTDIFDTYVFRILSKTFDIGLGTAAGLIQSVFGLVLVTVSNAFVKRVVPDYALF